MKKIKVGTMVYCDIHSQSKEHVVTHVSEEEDSRELIMNTGGL